MSATVLTPVVAAGKWDQVGVVVTMTALDNTNGDQFACPNDGFVVVQNTDSGSHSFQMTSQPLSSTGRTGDVNQAVAAGAIRVFRIAKDGWADVNGNVQLPSGQSAFLKVGILQMA